MWGASAMLQLAVAGQSGCGTMYLFTLVFILLTVFGVFTEIVALQNTRFAAMRTGGAQQLVAWHSSTVTAARYSVGGVASFPTWGTAVNPCSIVAGAQAPIAGMPVICRDALGVNPMRLDALVVAAGNTINFITFEATTPNGTIELTKKEALLLKLLIDRKNEVVSRHQILQTVWGYDVYPSTRTIDNFILSFRKYFEVDPKEPVYFHSVRGVGYKFVA